MTYQLHLSKLLHFVGIGVIFTTIFAGAILNGRYRKAPDWKTKLMILKLLRPIGLLSPVGVAVMLVSGILNMHFSNLGLFTASWLTLKLVFFALTVISGILFGVKGTQRSILVTKLAEGNAPEGTDRSVGILDRQQRIFYFVQLVLILIILTLSIFKLSA